MEFRTHLSAAAPGDARHHRLWIAFARVQVLTNAAREGARIAVLPNYAQADVTARVDQYCCSGCPERNDRCGSAAVAAPDRARKCIQVVPVTVTYNHQYTFVGGNRELLRQLVGVEDLTYAFRPCAKRAGPSRARERDKGS